MLHLQRTVVDVAVTRDGRLPALPTLWVSKQAVGVSMLLCNAGIATSQAKAATMATAAASSGLQS